MEHTIWHVTRTYLYKQVSWLLYIALFRCYRLILYTRLLALEAIKYLNCVFPLVNVWIPGVWLSENMLYKACSVFCTLFSSLLYMYYTLAIYDACPRWVLFFKYRRIPQIRYPFLLASIRQIGGGIVTFTRDNHYRLTIICNVCTFTSYFMAQVLSVLTIAKYGFCRLKNLNS